MSTIVVFNACTEFGQAFTAGQRVTTLDPLQDLAMVMSGLARFDGPAGAAAVLPTEGIVPITSVMYANPAAYGLNQPSKRTYEYNGDRIHWRSTSSGAPSSSWSPVPGAGIFTPNMPTFEAVLAAVNAAAAAGGGVVSLGRYEYDFAGQTIPPQSAVTIRGIKPKLQFTGITDDGGVTFVAGTGTIIKNTPLAFGANLTDLGGPQTTAAFANSCLNNMAIESIGFDSTVGTGIKIGAAFNGGPIYSRFKDLYAIGCTSWGFWFENFIHTDFDGVRSYACGIGGQEYRVSEGGCGNSSWKHIFNSAKPLGALTRGICFRHTATSGQGFGALNIDIIQSNRFNNTPEWTSGAVTPTNGSPVYNVGAGNAAKFPVDLPIKVVANANGLTTQSIYFVVSNDGLGGITISDTAKGTPLNSTGTASVTFKTTGFAPIEFVAEASNGSIGAGTITGIDAESGGTALVVAQRFGGMMTFNAIAMNASYVTLALRASGKTTIISTADTIVDMDAASAQRVTAYGLFTTWTNYFPQGAYSSSDDGMSLGLFNGNRFDTATARFRNGQQIKWRRAHVWADPIPVSNGWSLSFNDSVNMLRWNDSGAGGSFTLPPLTADHIGYPMFVSNPTANPVTINAASGQTFNNKSGATSIVLASKQSVQLVGDVHSGSYYWAVQSGTITV